MGAKIPATTTDARRRILSAHSLGVFTRDAQHRAHVDEAASVRSQPALLARRAPREDLRGRVQSPRQYSPMDAQLKARVGRAVGRASREGSRASHPPASVRNSSNVPPCSHGTCWSATSVPATPSNAPCRASRADATRTYPPDSRWRSCTRAPIARRGAPGAASGHTRARRSAQNWSRRARFACAQTRYSSMPRARCGRVRQHCGRGRST